jgi:hypothetical protein
VACGVVMSPAATNPYRTKVSVVLGMIYHGLFSVKESDVTVDFNWATFACILHPWSCKVQIHHDERMADWICCVALSWETYLRPFLDLSSTHLSHDVIRHPLQNPYSRHGSCDLSAFLIRWRDTTLFRYNFQVGTAQTASFPKEDDR